MQENQQTHRILTRGHGPSIAYAQSPGANGSEGSEKAPGVIFFGGFMSDMTGVKATWLEGFAGERGLPFLRFDYSGHGASEGRFEDGTIGTWLGDVLHVLDTLTTGPQVLVGSSMGGWLALLAALKRPDRICGIVGLASAPDFTEDLVHSELTADEREILLRDGVVYKETDYGDRPYAFTRALVEEGRNHLLLGGPIAITCPVRLLHGLEDADVPWELALAILKKLQSENAGATLIKDGDHRLSRAQDLACIGAAVMEVIAAANEGGQGA